MVMHYPRSLFALQLTFAQRVATRFPISLFDAIRRFTPIAATLQIEDTWEPFAQALEHARDMLEVIYQAYVERVAGKRLPQPTDVTFRDWPLFGCFYYAVREPDTIRTHFINNDLPGMKPLSSGRQVYRREELRRMFVHVRDHVPSAKTVEGHSWLYNLAAYTRLFPPSYIHDMKENPDGVLDQMVLWYQCYDRVWEVKPAIAAELLQRVEQVTDLADLRHCFPYQRLRTKAPIADFYTFYEIALSRD